MTAKEFLSRYRTLNAEIDSLTAECERLRSLAEKSGGSIIDGTMGKTIKSDHSPNFVKIVERIDELEKNINQKIDKLITLRGEIETAIETVTDDTLRTLLRYRYINGYTFERCSVEMSYSYIHIVKNLHPKALCQVRVY